MKILVAPLDWGLGHATRLVPVIREFLKQGYEVDLAVTPLSSALYKKIFPDLKKIMAPSYGIVYPKFGFNMGLWLLKNSIHLNKIIRFENHYAEEMVKKHRYDILLSDNRFGFFSSKAYSIYMTHQCRIAFPPLFSKFESIGILWHQSKMKSFNKIWIPDVPEGNGYAGSLSHLKNKIKNSSYIGPLTRFTDVNLSEIESTEPKIETVSIISGVEPAKTRFQEKLRKILLDIPGRHIMVLGHPEKEPYLGQEKNIEYYNHLETKELIKKVKSCHWVLSRGGYSTIMDMAYLNAKCIFIPTPGQYEQVVLAKNLEGAHFAESIPENKLTKENLLEKMSHFVQLPNYYNKNLLSSAIREVFKGI